MTRNTNWASLIENLILLHANTKGTNQRSMIRAFVIMFLVSTCIIAKLISHNKLVVVVE